MDIEDRIKFHLNFLLIILPRLQPYKNLNTGKLSLMLLVQLLRATSPSVGLLTISLVFLMKNSSVFKENNSMIVSLPQLLKQQEHNHKEVVVEVEEVALAA